jgi:hypothetical protein
MFGIPLPYIALAIGIALFGSYRGGYHFGWQDRDNDMKIAIAKKNDEARAKEKELGEKLQDQETKLRKAQDDVKKKQSAMHELASTGRLRLPAPSCPQNNASATTATGIHNPASPMQANLSDRLLQLLSTSQPKETKLSPSSTPAPAPTKK